jgi:hypothetical protein
MAVGAFSNTQGTGGSSGTLTATLRQYTSSGTWTKPTGLKFIEIICIGGGSGGGSGARSATSVTARGGNGGAGGGLTYRILLDTDLSATEAYVIGAGGVGAPGATTDSTAAQLPTVGSETTFGTGPKAQARGGTTGIAQASGSSYSDFSRWNLAGPTSSPSGFNGNSASQQSLILPTFNQIIGAASGGGVQSSNTATIGGTGCTYLGRTGASTTSPAAAGAVGGNGGAGSNNATARIYTQTMFNAGATLSIGTSGGGGGGAVTSAAGSGGNGGLYGGAGAGGGGSRNGFLSGKGGDGGAGCIIIIEHTLA